MNLLGSDNSNKVSKYQASREDLSYWELKFGEWYLKHRVLIRKALVAILFLFSLVTLGGSLTYWGYYYSSGYWTDKQITTQEIEQFQNYRNLQPLYEAKPVEVSNVNILKTASEKYNVVAQINNVNKRWWGKITYHFNFSGGETEKKEAMLLPGRENTRAIFGVENDNITQGAEFAIDDMEWKKVNPHNIPQVQNYMRARLNFPVNNFSFSTGDDDTPPNVNFSVTNNTAYSYWDGRFLVEFYDGNSLVAVKDINLEKFRTGEERQVNLTFLENINITRMELNPKINAFTQEAYMEPPS